MAEAFIRQTGLGGDVAEYATPERSRVAAMAYTGETPWHELGVRVDGAMTWEEAVEKSGMLDFEVEHRPLYVPNTQGSLIEVPNRKAVVRIDTNEVFNVTSPRYAVFQNREIGRFSDDLVASGEAVYHTAGVLYGGRRVWMLLKLPQDVGIDNDMIEQYLLISNSHDGSSKLQVAITPIRVVCVNTERVALADATAKTSYRHSGDLTGKVEKTREALNLTDAYFMNFQAGMERLAERRFKGSETETFFKKIAGWTTGDEWNADLPYETQKPHLREAFDALNLLYTDGPGAKLSTADGTAWGAFNAVTAYTDHVVATKGAKSGNPMAIDRRMDRSWFGYGQKVRQAAWDEAMKMAMVPVKVTMGGSRN